MLVSAKEVRFLLRRPGLQGGLNGCGVLNFLCDSIWNKLRLTLSPRSGGFGLGGPCAMWAWALPTVHKCNGDVRLQAQCSLQTSHERFAGVRIPYMALACSNSCMYFLEDESIRRYNLQVPYQRKRSYTLSVRHHLMVPIRYALPLVPNIVRRFLPVFLLAAVGKLGEGFAATASKNPCHGLCASVGSSPCPSRATPLEPASSGTPSANAFSAFSAFSVLPLDCSARKPEEKHR